MTTAVLRPNATVSSVSWTRVGGAASNHATLNDDLDSTYLEEQGATATTTLDFGTVAIPSLAQIRAVTARIRAVLPAAGAAQTFGWTVSVPSDTGGYVNHSQDTVSLNGSEAISTYVGLARTSGPVSAWSQALLDGIRLTVTCSPYVSTNKARVHEAYIDVLYNEAPVATQTSGASQATSQPVVTWTYSDPEGDLQERYWVKVFSVAVAGAAGFNPETSAALWDSGSVSSNTLSVTASPTGNLASVVAFVKVADVGSNGRFGAWTAGTTISITQIPPPVPTLNSAVFSAVTAAATISADVATTSAIAATYILVERSDDGGTTWVVVRAGTVLTGFTDADNFTRADNAASLGSTSTKVQPWTSALGTWGILSNRAYSPTLSGGAAIAVLDDAGANGIVSCTLNALVAGPCGIVFRYVDSNNYWRLTSNSTFGNLVLQKLVGGVATIPTDGNISLAGDPVMKAEFDGSTIKIYANNILKATIVDSALMTGQKAGLYSESTTARWSAYASGPITPIIVVDYEAKPSATTKYRVSALNANATLLRSAPSALATLDTSLPSWWLKDPLDPTRNVAIQMAPGSLELVYTEALVVFEPLGRADHVVLTDSVVRLAKLGLEVAYFSTAQRDALVRLQSGQRPLLLQDPTGRQWYVRVGSELRVMEALTPDRRSTPSVPHGRVVFRAVEVAKP